ncbi:hypothetical protein FEM55_05950 [Dyadobacter sediminis]|uniref:Uncharacterized protein n=1 Tax=Dyadobacter sediminis TaxID=1493691 RepID=A0A5R9KKD9_9BACT|nr:hypothetical protein FEM55_05950 [Dyadobacter sediminis]
MIRIPGPNLSSTTQVAAPIWPIKRPAAERPNPVRKKDEWAKGIKAKKTNQPQSGQISLEKTKKQIKRRAAKFR